MENNHPTQDEFPPHDPIDIRKSLYLPKDAPDAHVIDRLSTLISFLESERRTVKKLCTELIKLVS
jgi:hypothetical protein